MGSIRIYKGMPPLTEEQIKRLRENAPKSDDDIDFSDIPKMTKEELSKFRPWRLRQKNLKTLRVKRRPRRKRRGFVVRRWRKNFLEYAAGAD